MEVFSLNVCSNFWLAGPARIMKLQLDHCIELNAIPSWKCSLLNSKWIRADSNERRNHRESKTTGFSTICRPSEIKLSPAAGAFKTSLNAIRGIWDRIYKSNLPRKSYYNPPLNGGGNAICNELRHNITTPIHLGVAEAGQREKV